MNLKTLTRIGTATDAVRDRFNRVSKAHGIQYSWLKDISGDLEQLLNKLDNVIRFKQNTFYPKVTELKKQREQLLDGTVQKIRRSVAITEEDYRTITNFMNRIEKVAWGFQFGESACSTPHILCERLKTLFEEVRYHISVEREQLIPKVEKFLNV